MRSVLLGVAKQPSILEAVEALDPEDPKYKWKLYALAERAMDVSGANDRRERGSHLHELSEYVDRGEPLPERTKFGVTDEDDLRDMAAYRMMTVWFDVREVEQFVVNSALGTGGTFDRRLWYAGPGPAGIPWIEDHFIGDLKTGSTEYGGLKMASQLAVYADAERYDHLMFPAPDRLRDEKAWNKWKRTEVPAEEAAKAYTPIEVNKDWGIIISLPSGSGECNLYWADLNKGRIAAEEATTIRSLRSTKDPLLPFVTEATQAEVDNEGESV
jgi:hypothetical protein